MQVSKTNIALGLHIITDNPNEIILPQPSNKAHESARITVSPRKTRPIMDLTELKIPSTPSEKLNYAKNAFKSPSTLSMKMRTEAVLADKNPPRIAATYFPSIELDLNTKPKQNDQQLLQKSNNEYTTPRTPSNNSYTKPKIKLNLNPEQQHHQHTLQVIKSREQIESITSRLSGLHDNMALEVSKYGVFPDRSIIRHPTTICVHCSNNHASICMQCSELLMDKSVDFYRISRAQGALVFFDNAIIRAGQKHMTEFIIFTLWKNYITRISRIRGKFVACVDC